MVKKVFKSFDYANLLIDFEKKNYQVTYPHTTPKIMEWILFGVISLALTFIPAMVITGVLIIYFDIIDIGFWVWLLLWGVMMVFCFKTRYIREWIIKAGETVDAQEVNQIYIEGIKKKQVVIKNAGNYLTEYELYGDYKKYIKTFEVKCVKCKKQKYKWMSPKYQWQIIVTFSKIPKKGKMIILNQRGGNDETTGNGRIVVEYN